MSLHGYLSLLRDEEQSLGERECGGGDLIDGAVTIHELVLTRHGVVDTKQNVAWNTTRGQTQVKSAHESKVIPRTPMDWLAVF